MSSTAKTILTLIVLAAVGLGAWQLSVKHRMSNTSDVPPPGSNNSATSADTSTWQTYTNVKYGYEISYPSEYSALSYDVNGSEGPIDQTATSGSNNVQIRYAGSAVYIYIAGIYDQGVPPQGTFSQADEHVLTNGSRYRTQKIYGAKYISNLSGEENVQPAFAWKIMDTFKFMK